MARTRIVVDVVHDEPLSRRQMQQLASNTSDWLQAIGASEVENKDANQAFSHGHLHVSTMDEMCGTCVSLARDGAQ